MSKSSGSSSRGGVGCLTVVGVVLVILKLTGLVDLTWLQVLMPFIIQAVIYIFVVFLAVLYHIFG